MKSLLRIAIVRVLWTTLLVAVPLTATVSAFETITNIENVRKRGRSEPPFLNYTAPPNLLLLLDNSGSMLDMAYIDSSTKVVNNKTVLVNQCTDRTDRADTLEAPNFDNSSEEAYTGYFDPKSWYQWTPGTIAAWQSWQTYQKDQLVYDNGIVYQCTTDSCNSIGTSLGNAPNAEVWMPIIQGPTQQPPSGFAYSNGTLSYSSSDSVSIDEGSFTVVSQATGCSSKDYSNDYVCVKFDNTTTPTKVTNFAATGKFLNWLSASKFDIQKKVLTGGKYNATDQLLISENRGCAGSGFIKETTAKDNSNISKTLSFRVRGAESGNPVAHRNDKIAATDDTTRIEILGVISDGASIINDDCKGVIADVMAGANLNSQSNAINECLTPLRTAIDPEVSDQRPMLNHALQFCQKLFDGSTRNLNAAIGECEKLYDTYKPWEISPSYGAYACYGVYDASTNHRNRAGYMGRCWDAGTVLSSGEECTLVPDTVDPPDPFIDASGNLYRNLNGHLEKCLDTVVRKGVYSCKKSTDWRPLYQINNAGETYDNIDTCRNHSSTATTTATTTAGKGWVPPDPVKNINCTDYNNPSQCVDYGQCVFQGMVDYCKSLSIPEVIDPSDQATTTTDFWNFPATLIDSGVIVALGTDRPLAVMKGRIKQMTPPSGILQEKGLNLRIGAMKINPVGAQYECSTGTTSGTVQPFCPPDNKDGAQLIAPLALGSLPEPSNLLISHVQQVANEINDAQANTWTPLAEAVFSAMGYLSQRSDMCINSGANPLSGTEPCWDFPISPSYNPVQSPCQSNHLLVITEGASTRDVNNTVTNSTAAAFTADGTILGGQQCDSVLRGSTYLNNIAAFGYYSVPDRGEFSSDSAYEAALDEAETRARLLYNGTGMFNKEFTAEGMKQGIITHIITTGSLRSDLGTVASCDPATLMDNAAKNGGSTMTSTGKYYVSGESPSEFSAGLSYIFDAILQRASTGSSASVVSTSRSGEGAVYQAIFWPEQKSAEENKTITWAGDVHALFVDGNGYMREDTNLNSKLDADDQRITIYYDDDPAENKSKGCYQFEDNKCINSVKLDEIKYLWSVNSWLQSITDQDYLLTNRSTYISNNKQRYIFTWNDLNGDGVVDEDIEDENKNEIIPFDTATAWHNKDVSNRGPIFNDFGLTFNATNPALSNTNLQKLVSWIRGQESEGYRSRTLSGKKFLLGDVIHSTPMVVGAPQENFHLLYNDQSYEEFAARYKNRRQVLYFGGNDGMFHAVNGGFYDSDKKMFCRSKECELTNDGMNENPSSVSNEPELGAELWAYVPYNLQPHLEYLAHPDYLHKYFVDLRPRIFDAQIFPEDNDHPNGWGTILVGGMRFGGAPVHARELNGLSNDNRVFTSAYFVFDITNPENPPRLLGEMNRKSDDVGFIGTTGSNDVGTDMGYSTAIPTMVIMKKDGQLVGSVNNKWYLIFGSGPHSYRNINDPLGDRALKGFSDQNAKLAVLPLDKLVTPGTGVLQALRIPDSAPSSANAAGTKIINDASRGFVSDLITVDFDINPTSKDYLADAVYFGTVEANTDDAKGGFGFDSNNNTTWDGGGKLYRMVTRNLVEKDNSSFSYYIPSSMRALLATNSELIQSITTPDAWPLSVLMNPGRPITGAPSVAYDGDNFWIYFGTGRYFNPNDKTDSQQQAYYGLKEPMASVKVGDDTVKKFTWGTLSLMGTKTAAAGSKGLARVDNILVQDSNSPSNSKLTCWNDDTMSYDTTKSCYPPEIAVDSSGDAHFDDLITYIAGAGSCSTTDKSNCADGWYKNFHDARERNLGQSTILGGLVTFTTYQPYSDPCKSEGISNLYGVYYQTGTAWHKNIFGIDGLDIKGNVKDKLEIGLGLTTTPNLYVGGSDDDSVTAFVQTSTGEIKAIKQENLPIQNYKTGRTGWKEYSR